MHQNNEENQKNLSPIAAGITGLILGIVGTAAVALSDKDTRKKATQKAGELKDNFKKWTEDTLHNMETTGEDIKKQAASKLDSGKTSSTRPADDMKIKAEETFAEEKKALEKNQL